MYKCASMAFIAQTSPLAATKFDNHARPTAARCRRFQPQRLMALIASSPLRSSLLEILGCPRDGSDLRIEGGALCCAQRHVYPVVNGIPVFLLSEKEQTIGIAQASLVAAQSLVGAPLFVDTIGVSDEEKQAIEKKWEGGANAIDPVISYLVGATSGHGYKDLIGQMTTYPIPNIPLPCGDGRMLLDVGSNWGRWSVSAARKGWQVTALDPSLGALLAAKRAFANEKLEIDFVCGDARFMPFKANRFSAVFSYSVIQHFSESDAARAIAEIGRLLASGGEAKIQMANVHGFRSIYMRTRKNYLSGGKFRVRYWSLPTLKKVFTEKIGPTTISAEAFGGLGLLAEDWWIVNGKTKVLIVISLLLRKISRLAPVLVRFADSVFLSAHKR
jgi:ubiquinone/menaquinone biosynthesis C-methylase UbiE/uncharacterized protein YbaR (Trm112 family)